MNAYSSHLPTLKLLFERFNIKTVLELGIGDSSTPFFLERGVLLTSVESGAGWTNQYKHEVIIGSMLDFLQKDNRQFDLAFVDSNPASERYKCVELLFGKTKIIVAHDTEPESEWNYSYSKIILPPGWHKFDFNEEVPWTSVYTINELVYI